MRISRTKYAANFFGGAIWLRVTKWFRCGKLTRGIAHQYFCRANKFAGCGLDEYLIWQEWGEKSIL